MCEKCTCWPDGLGRIRRKLHSRKACRPTRLGRPCESPNCTFGLLRQQTRFPWTTLETISIASGSAALFLPTATLPPIQFLIASTKQVRRSVIRTLPPVQLSSHAVNAGLWTCANGPCGLQVRPPPPPRSRTSWPILVLCTTMPSATVDMMLPPTALLLESVGRLGCGSSRHGDDFGLHPRISTPPLCTNMLPATFTCESRRPKATISAEWRVTM